MQPEAATLWLRPAASPIGAAGVAAPVSALRETLAAGVQRPMPFRE